MQGRPWLGQITTGLAQRIAAARITPEEAVCAQAFARRWLVFDRLLLVEAGLRQSTDATSGGVTCAASADARAGRRPAPVS